MRRTFAALTLAATIFLAAPAFAADAPSKDGDSKDKIELPLMSPDKTVDQTVSVGGRVVHYKATVGHIDIRDDKGKVTGQVVYTAYVVPSAGAARPVTFAFNGGPGAASVFLNMGAIGPKRVPFGAQGDSPSDPAVLRDNPATWLDFTDLVFIDPVGTGFSRSMVDADETKKDFYNSKNDIEYLSRVVYDWLTKYGRMTSRKYLVGESYGGYRVPRLAYYLQSQMGVGVSGLVMVSPYLDPSAIGNETSLSPLPWMINLPSMTAGNYERQGRRPQSGDDERGRELRPNRLRHRFPEGYIRPRRHRPAVGQGCRLHRHRPGAGPAARRPSRYRHLPARDPPQHGPGRQRLRFRT